MKPEPRFQKQPKHFWANVRTISQVLGYTIRGQSVIRVPTLGEIIAAFRRLKLNVDHVASKNESPSEFGHTLCEYFAYRASVLNSFVEPRLMNAKDSQRLFHGLKRKLKPTCPIPFNKQTGDKKAEAFLTGIVNMLIEANAKGYHCDFDPHILTTITRDSAPFRTLARRVDGAFPSTINPIAVWEIKEYYYTTTFGSRVADGVYETLLDGMELEELREHGGIDVKHYLIVDSHYTWWECGKSYLCRIIDMLHMGYVDEVLFGREVVDEMPRIVKEWIAIAKAQGVKKNRSSNN